MHKACVVKLVTEHLGMRNGVQLTLSSGLLLVPNRMDLLETYGKYYKATPMWDAEWFTGSSMPFGSAWKNKNKRESYFVRAL